MLGSVGSIVPKRWILGIFALGLIAGMVATSANPWAGAATVPTSVTASAVSSTSITVNWTAVGSGSTVPAGGTVDSYNVSCLPTGGSATSQTVAGFGTATATFTGLTASTEYTCSVAAVATGSTPGTAVNAAAITTPADLSKVLGSIVVSPSDGRVQQDTGAQNISVAAKGSDTSKTVITTGLTYLWSVSGGGTINPTNGSATTFTAGGPGTSTVSVTVSQASTGASKNDSISVEVFAVAPDPVPEPPVAPPAALIPALPVAPTGTVEGTFDTVVLTPVSTLTTLEVTGDPSLELGTTTASLSIPPNSVPPGIGVSITSIFVPPPPLVAPLPAAVLPPPAKLASIFYTVDVVDTLGNDVTLTNDIDVVISFSLTDLTSGSGSGLTADLVSGTDIATDVSTLALFKADDPSVGPWTELATEFAIAGDKVVLSAKTRNFSTFRIGSKTRELGVPGTPGAGPILPSAGDVAPTTTQALLLAGLGLVLLAGGGVYVRRQRRATFRG